MVRIFFFILSLPLFAREFEQNPWPTSVDEASSAPILLETPTTPNTAVNETRLQSNSSDTVGALFATIPGFGIGHAIQGRYWKNGWLFTSGEVVSLAGALSILNVQCGSINRKDCNAAKAVGVLITAGVFIGMRIWEIVDAWNYDSTLQVSLLPINESQTEGAILLMGWRF